ncbi:MAG: hypothetical protein QOF51_884 [Chloroflexota bacterium]|jgi:DNA-directed RNA polymerase specialized sigma24 family protein|nr:hypothetical protein [Chloroflexota bacterium]
MIDDVQRIEVESDAATTLYRELVERETQSLYEIAMLLTGDRAVAEAAVTTGFRRLWQLLGEGEVFADAEQLLYRATVRASLGQLNRNKSLRGLLPPTTADDRQITAFGIVGNLTAEQRAAVLVAAWLRRGYATAGSASGVGEARASDLAFASRQEYREARGGPPDVDAVCHAIAPLLSARADGGLTAPEEEQVADHLITCPVCPTTATLYDEFATALHGLRIPPPTTDLQEVALGEIERRPRAASGSALKRALRLAIGPLVLVGVLIAALILLRGCSEPSIQTGAGRTSDVILGTDPNGGLVEVDAGSGRILAKLPAGVVSPDGQRDYTAAATCADTGCRTQLRVVDTATLEAEDIGRIDGQLAPIAVTEATKRLLLGDEASGWSRLAVFDLEHHQLAGNVAAPAGYREAYRPGTAALTQGGARLVTLGTGGAGEAGVVLTDLTALQVAGTIAVPGTAPERVVLLAPPDRPRAYVYDVAQGRLTVVDVDGRRVEGTALLAPGSDGDQSLAAAPGMLALGPDGSVYAVLPSGGIGVVALGDLQAVRRLGEDQHYRAVAVATDGKLVYGLRADGSYVALDAATGELRLRRASVQVASFGQVIAGE